MTGVYAIHNMISNKYYIGQARDIEYRWMQHRSRLKCNTHENKHLQDAYNKYGKDAFKYFVVEECDVSLLDDKEIMYIKQYDSYRNGYNQDEGGSGCKGYKHTEEEIMKMRFIQNPKAVLQLDKDLNVIAEWVSCSHAGKTLGFSIRQIKSCCNRVNRQKTVKGFYFVYKEEYESGTVDWGYYLNINESQPIRVSQYTLDMKLVKIWDSIYQACQANGFTRVQITRNCEFKSLTAYNFVWRFTDKYTQEQYEKDCATNFQPTRDNSSIRISQYDLHMNLIKIWDSLRSITLETGWSAGGIVNSCEHPERTSHNFVWRYTDCYTQEQYEKDLQTNFKETKSVVPIAVLQYTLGGEFIAKYASKQKAAKAVGLSPSTIHNRCTCSIDKSKDYIFRYETNNLISQ